jgi:hypothetical protein
MRYGSPEEKQMSPFVSLEPSRAPSHKERHTFFAVLIFLGHMLHAAWNNKNNGTKNCSAVEMM